jgi:hypothetical protein
MNESNEHADHAEALGCEALGLRIAVARQNDDANALAKALIEFQSMCPGCATSVVLTLSSMLTASVNASAHRRDWRIFANERLAQLLPGPYSDTVAGFCDEVGVRDEVDFFGLDGLPD